MKNPEIVLQELGDLYEFYRQIKKFKIIDRKESKNPKVRVVKGTDPNATQLKG